MTGVIALIPTVTTGVRKIIVAMVVGIAPIVIVIIIIVVPAISIFLIIRRSPGITGVGAILFIEADHQLINGTGFRFYKRGQVYRIIDPIRGGLAVLPEVHLFLGYYLTYTV